MQYPALVLFAELAAMQTRVTLGHRVDHGEQWFAPGYSSGAPR
ncbi:hypothetical protein M8Z33_04135 [Streptomyces sp. ZAF1911]|nr:hypothetical protein [Streptomyces sp. ZAF1911]MDD9375869.1 hypothetical protein [Streptomyces sp. ZAF1911]